MNLSYRFVALVLTGSALALACLAQNTSPTLAGRWQGNYKIPGGQDLGVIVDLTKNPKGAWVGSFSMPEFQANDIPVEQLSVTQNQVHFVVSGVFGNPAFDGSLGSDGKLSGTFGDPQHKTPLALNRTGAAQVKLPEPSTPIGKDVEGTWHATLSAGDTQTRMLLKLSRAPDGTATGMMINVDQGNREVPLTSIHQKDQTLEFEIRPAVVHYRGTIKAPGGPISGDWTQMSRSAPLTFERGPFPANSQLPKAFEGTWQGTLDAGPGYQINLVMTLTRAADGSAVGVLKMSDGNRELPANPISVKGKSFGFSVAGLGATFAGNINDAGTEISGTWLLAGTPMPLVLKRPTAAKK